MNEIMATIWILPFYPSVTLYHPSSHMANSTGTGRTKIPISPTLSPSTSSTAAASGSPLACNEWLHYSSFKEYDRGEDGEISKEALASRHLMVTLFIIQGV
jgi:hypothetical protein